MEAKQQPHTHIHIGGFIITLHGKALLTSYQDRKPEKASSLCLAATVWLIDLKQ